MKMKFMKQTLLLILTFFIFTSTVYSQKRVTVDATGEVMMDADLITMNVQMISSGESAEEVFERHKEQERMFAALIKEHGLEESLVFQPMRMGIHQIGRASCRERVKRTEGAEAVKITTKHDSEIRAL